MWKKLTGMISDYLSSTCHATSLILNDASTKY